MHTLLGASLLFGGCSLSMPKEQDLFGGRDTMDASMDAASGSHDDEDGSTSIDTGLPPDRDAALALDSGTDAGDPGHTGGDGDAGQDGGSSMFDPEQGLVIHYRFNETTGNAVHDFASSHDALVVGTPDGFSQWVNAGRVDGALKLAGGDAPDAGTGHYVELPQGIFLGLKECTISLWVNRSGGSMWQRVFDFGSGPPVWLFFTPYGGTGLPVVAGRTPALIFVDYQPIPDAPDGEGELHINQPIPVATWVHVALTWSGQEVKVYLDGKLVAQAVPNGGVTPQDLGNTGQNYLGRSQFVADPYFDGLIDELRIYDHVLNASEVAKLHDAP